MKVKITSWEQYHKKENCGYPFTPEPLGYCWSYATDVDNEVPAKETEATHCRHCEFYKPVKGA